MPFGFPQLTLPNNTQSFFPSSQLPTSQNAALPQLPEPVQSLLPPAPSKPTTPTRTPGSSTPATQTNLNRLGNNNPAMNYYQKRARYGRNPRSRRRPHITSRYDAKCFNCGSSEHVERRCTQPRDADRILKNRIAFMLLEKSNKKKASILVSGNSEHIKYLFGLLCDIMHQSHLPTSNMYDNMTMTITKDDNRSESDFLQNSESDRGSVKFSEGPPDPLDNLFVQAIHSEAPPSPTLSSCNTSSSILSLVSESSL